MENKFKPVIIVVAYNRERSLNRLLKSLLNSVYPADTKLIISIDRADNNQNVYYLANEFNWPFGNKEIIYQKNNLGLKNHIIKCCDLVNEYGSIIILEDDLYVSKHFYDYATKALNFYSEDENISGISLYKYPAIERRVNPLPFIPLEDNSDVHFIQFASSWGQAWTKNQWNSFKNWYDKKPNLSKLGIELPFTVFDWPHSSWKKYFISYMISQNKYFVFPNKSLSTNFDDPGSNRLFRTFIYQAPLKMDDDTSYKFIGFQDANNIYDASFELLPETFKKFNTDLDDFNFDVDLYGIKKTNELKKPFVLTSQHTEKSIKSYARSLKPHEMNVILNINGNDIFLTKRDDIIGINDKKHQKNYNKFYEKKQSDLLKDYNYFFRKPGNLKETIQMIIYQIIQKFK